MPDDGPTRGRAIEKQPTAPTGPSGAAPHRTSRLLVAFGAFLIASSIAATAAVLWQLREATLARAEADLQRFATILAEQTFTAVQAIDLAMSSLIDAPRATPDQRRALHVEMRSAVARLPPLQNLFASNRDGNSAISARSDPPPRVTVADRLYFRMHRDGVEGPVFSPTLRNRVDGRWSMVMSRRLAGPGAVFDGVMGADIDPSYLARFYATVNLGPDAGITLVDRQGTLLARHPWVDAAVGRPLPGGERFAAQVAAASVGNFRAVSPFDGTVRLHGYAAIDLYPLVIATSAGLDAVLAPWREQAVIAGGAVLAADAVIAALIAFLVLQIRRRETSEARFRDFAGAASDLYWETDAGLRFTYVSRPGHERVDAAARSAIGRRMREVILALPGDETRLRFEADLRARLPFREFLCQVGTPGGRLRHLNISGQPRFDSAGAFLGYRGVARDITTEVEARSASAQANMRFLHAIENSSDGIAFWDAEDRFVLCNDRYRRQLGRAGRRLMSGMTFERFVWEAIRLGDISAPPGKAAEALAWRMAHHRAATGEAFEMEYGGEWRLVRDQRTPDGGTLVIWTDITALKSKDAALQAAQHDAERARLQFFVAIEHSDDGFALWDAGDRFVLCNEKFRERAGAAVGLLMPGTLFEDFLRESVRRGELRSDTMSGDELICRRMELHRRAAGEPLEVTRGGRRLVIRDQRTPDGGCLVISTEVTGPADVAAAPARGLVAGDGRPAIAAISSAATK